MKAQRKEGRKEGRFYVVRMELPLTLQKRTSLLPRNYAQTTTVRTVSVKKASENFPGDGRAALYAVPEGGKRSVWPLNGRSRQVFYPS